MITASLCLALALQGSVRPPPPLEDFVALTSRDEKVAAAAAARLAPVWKDSYAGMVIDLARFFRSERPGVAPGAADDAISGDDGAETGRTVRGREVPFAPTERKPESIIRSRLIRFLSKQTRKSFGDDLKQWRKWSWTLPYDPHPEYASFKARLYANVDPRMAAFFPSTPAPRIRLDEIDWGGVGVNGIPPLDHPKVVPAGEAKFMGERNVVFGMVVNGEARAYPKRILAWHEMALDTLGGVKLAVVYCTLCGTVIPYESVVEGRAITLGTSGLLYRSNKLMFDHETRSLWSTLEGKPVLGPLAVSEIVLKYRPVVTTTWREWRTAHPDTSVVSLDTGYQRDYDEGAAYRTYFSHDELMFEVPAQDSRLKRKAEVVSFFGGDESNLVPVAIDAAFLKRNPVYAFKIKDADYVAFTSGGGANRIYRSGGVRFLRYSENEAFDDQARTWRVSEDRLEGPGGETLLREPARRTFWFAWFSQFPQTELIK